jgi:hypothetical protein
MDCCSRVLILVYLLSFINHSFAQDTHVREKPRVIVTSDGEIDDECSLVRFLLYANEWDIEGIVTSSSQYHSHGHNWAGDDWVQPYLDAYAIVYPNLVKHDGGYPTAEYLQAHTFLGNVEAEGEMDASYRWELEEMTVGVMMLLLWRNTRLRPGIIITLFGFYL